VIVILLGLILLQIFQRGIGEETGWRGFALPALMTKHSVFKANLILGLIWAIWHFHPANFNALISIGGFFVFFNIFLTTFLFTWLYSHTNGSLLMAILFHMLLNILEYIIPIGITETSLSRHFLRIGFILLTVVGIYVISFIGEDERIRIQ
jgi:membrane protease YdiL (CAAX protease family)